MFDVQSALNDLARQVRAARNRDGLTLHQLATRCGVAASTIHKIESTQMVPTLSVVLKIARGLGCSPQALVRDHANDTGRTSGQDMEHAGDAGSAAPAAQAVAIGVWRLACAPGASLARVVLEPGQRATLLVEQGSGELGVGARRLRVAGGDCIEIDGEPFRFAGDREQAARLLLIVSPAGELARQLGAPRGPRIG